MREEFARRAYLPDCNVIVVKNDRAPTKLDTGQSVIKIEEMIITCVTGYRRDGPSTSISPTIVKPPRLGDCGGVYGTFPRAMGRRKNAHR